MRRRPHRTAWTLAALAVVAGAARDATTAQAPARHHVVLWTFDDDATRPGFADAVRALGADAVSAAPSQDASAFAKAGLSWYEDAAAGKGTLGLREKDWKPAWDDFFAARKDRWPEAKARSRPVCLRDPAVVKRLEDETRKNARRASTGAFAISLDDEPSTTVRANPVDWCLCDRCCAAFRDAMRAKYADLEALDAAWDVNCFTWDDVRPWTTAAMKARIRGVSQSKWNLAPWMETRAFQDRTFADLIAHLRDVADSVAPGVPCGVTGTQAPSAFGGWDYGLLRKSMSFVEPYDIGLALPICRDLFPTGTIVAQTVFPSGDDQLVARWRLWRGVARGANATIVWSSHDALTRGAACGLAPYGKALAADLALLSADGGVGAKLARATPYASGVVVLVSQASVAVRWMIDSEEDGDTWPRRLGSYEAAHSTAIDRREAAWRAVCGRGPRFVDVRDLESSKAWKQARSLLVLAPDVLCLADDEREAVRRALSTNARDAFRFLVDAGFGTFDELGRATQPFRPGGILVDPAFSFVSNVRAELPRVPVKASVVSADGGPTPRVELAFFEDGGSLYVVAVPAWNATSDDAGKSDASIQPAALTFTFETTDRAPRDVVDLRTGDAIGRVATWSSTSDAAGGLVFELR